MCKSCGVFVLKEASLATRRLTPAALEAEANDASAVLPPQNTMPAVAGNHLEMGQLTKHRRDQRVPGVSRPRSGLCQSCFSLLSALVVLANGYVSFVILEKG